MSEYFQQLNYTMANEDTNLEFDMVKDLKLKSILTVGGSGSRSLPFLGLPIERLKIVDVSPLQIKLIQFKLETIKQLTREEAIAFWHGEDQQKRKKILSALKLSEDLKEFISSQMELNGDDSAPLYWGKWEKTFQKFAKLAGLLYSEETRRGLFSATDSYAYYKKNIKNWRWSLILKIVGNSSIFNSLLYKGHFIKKNSKLSYFEYYGEAFERLFKLDIKRSHFLQLCFFGRVHLEEALPIEFRAEVFQAIKNSTVTPTYHQGSIFESGSEKFDFISLSDVPSYLGGDIEKNYLQIMKEELAPNGVIINRYYLRVPENMNLDGLKDVSHEFSSLSDKELVQMYQVHVLRKV